MVDSFGIFEGGGAKGLAHIGALKITEDKKINFIGIAGTSAGAIVASLVAAGYKADDLYEPNSDTGICTVDFVEMLGRKRWKLLSLSRTLSKIFNARKSFRIIAYLLLFLVLVASFFVFVFLVPKIIPAIIIFGGIALLILLNECLSKFGIFSTEKFEKWLNEELRKKLFPESDKSKIVNFADMPIPLTVIATDLVSRNMLVFSKKYHANESVARAVAASISIPGVFKPQISGKTILVDGGVLSNFPAWVFDDEREIDNQFAPTFGFKLHNALPDTETAGQATSGGETSVDPRSYEWKTFLGYIVAFVQTVLFGDNILEVREIEDLHLIPIKVATHTLDLDLEPKDRLALYNAGQAGANDFFKTYVGLRDSEEIELLLHFLHQNVLGLLNKPDGHLRVNLFLPVEPRRRKLRILYSRNMEDDTDDKLELALDEGAAGQCWRAGQPMLVDMEDARLTFETRWKMNKYKQALVRKSLKTLVSIPLIHKKSLDNSGFTSQNDVLAVLSMDSDEDLLEELKVLGDKMENTEVEALVNRISKRLIEALRR